MGDTTKLTTIGKLFDREVDRRIEEVIKVDQTDQEVLSEELAEYVVTDSIRAHFVEILDHYRETWQKPNEAIGAWISGFFGSGKSTWTAMSGTSA